MTSPTPPPGQHARQVSGLAGTMTVIAMGLGYSISIVEPTILSANISKVRAGLHLPGSTTSFVVGLATLTLAAAALGAGDLGDVYGKKRMYSIGLLGTIAFELVAAAAPNGVILMVARAGVGLAFAFLLVLSLAIINDVFPPDRRAAAIALYIVAGYTTMVPQPAIGSLLADHLGWRACFLVAPAMAMITIVITVRYVPETRRAARRLDLPGLALAAAALLGVIYGISRLVAGFKAGAVVPILVGILAAAGFVMRELHTPDPALDLRIFRSGRFSAAVTAGATLNFLNGGSVIVFAYYLVAVRRESPALLGFLLIPAILLKALAAAGAGRASARFGERAVLITGLAVLLADLLVWAMLGESTPMLVLFAAVALNAIGCAVVLTPQLTIMMSSAPPGLGGAVSAVKSAVGEASYSLGAALFTVVGTTLFVSNGKQVLAGSGITVDEANKALGVAWGGSPAAIGAAHVLDPERARWVVENAKHSMLYTIHTLSLIMAVVPLAAIVVALVLLRPKARPHVGPDAVAAE